ncbi:unnamed protein product [Dibothriocephalus latus]|uniref:Uncharacterized protein n=1 Tax=Dibothriocephalus latus TaxID=60516 RepID=A0A3P6PG18_DIBLA|nr:unnamed protein product [Dibothriocephalus latus]
MYKPHVHPNSKGFAGETHPNDWNERISCAMIAYRATENSSTGYTPLFVLTGPHFRLQEDSRMPAIMPTEYTRELLRFTYNIARERSNAEAERQKNYFDRQVNGIPYQLDDLLWRYQPIRRLSTSAKFYCPWEGSYAVLDVQHPTTYDLRNESLQESPPFTTIYKHSHGLDTPYHPPNLVALHTREERIETRGQGSCWKKQYVKASVLNLVCMTKQGAP